MGFLARAGTQYVGLAAYRGPWAMESLIRETAWMWLPGA